MRIMIYDSSEDFPNNGQDDSIENGNWYCMGARDRVNIPCRMQDTRLCRKDVKMTNF